MSTFLVTGSEGVLGKALLLKLIINGDHAVGLDIKINSDEKKQTHYKFNSGSVLDSEFLKEIRNNLNIDGVKIDGIVNCFYQPEEAAKFVPEHNQTGLKSLHTAFQEYDSSTFTKELEVNVAGLHNILRIFLPQDVDLACNVVNVSSVFGITKPNPAHLEFSDRFRFKLPGYSVSKAAIIAYTEYLSNLYAGSNFRFNSIAPGFIKHGQEENFIRRFDSRLSIRRFADLEEIIAPIEFLLSEASNYITGATLVVDGGYTVS